MTGKQRVREILREIWVKPDWTSDDPNEMADYQDREIDQALDSIEEIVKGVLGEGARFRKPDDDLDKGIEIGYNTLLAEQKQRWSGE